MFAKVLIFFFLSVTLTLATPVKREISINTGYNSLTGAVGQLWSQAKHAVNDYFESNPAFEDVYNDLKERASEVIEIGKEKLSELKAKYESLQKEAAQNFQETRKYWEARIQEVKEQYPEAVEAGHKIYNEVRRQAEAALDALRKRWQARFEEWRFLLQDAIENAQQYGYKNNVYEYPSMIVSASRGLYDSGFVPVNYIPN